MGIETGVLEKALQENFNHARHQEIQRERYLVAYWLVWAAIIAYAQRHDDLARFAYDHSGVFAFLSLISLITLISTLKWNAEFANHIAAAAAIADTLKLNWTTPSQRDTPNWPLPYPEFSGYMAFPLRFPLLLSVAPWLALVHCGGLALSLGFATFGVTMDIEYSIKIAVLGGVVGFAISYRLYQLMKRSVLARTPDEPQRVFRKWWA